MRERLPIVGVMGSGSHPHADLAEPLGRWLAAQGVHLLTGGGAGVMEAVSRAFCACFSDRMDLIVRMLCSRSAIWMRSTRRSSTAARMRRRRFSASDAAKSIVGLPGEEVPGGINREILSISGYWSPVGHFPARQPAFPKVMQPLEPVKATFKTRKFSL